jgi:hypothetical protein
MTLQVMYAVADGSRLFNTAISITRTDDVWRTCNWLDVVRVDPTDSHFLQLLCNISGFLLLTFWWAVSCYLHNLTICHSWYLVVPFNLLCGSLISRIPHWCLLSRHFTLATVTFLNVFLNTLTSSDFSICSSHGGEVVDAMFWVVDFL